MNPAGDAAEQIVRMSLNGVEVAAKITGAGAKHLAGMISAIMQGRKKTRGKARLATLLRSDKPLKVFAVKDNEMEIFCREARKYGVLYCVLKDKDATDGLTDILVKTEDAFKINRIFERFHLSTIEADQSKQDTTQQPVKESEQIPSPERSETKDKEETFLDLLMSKPPNAEKQQTENPTEGRVAKSRQSVPTSATKDTSARGNTASRPSVRQELKQIREEIEQTAKKPSKSPRTTEHATINHRKKRSKKHKER